MSILTEGFTSLFNSPNVKKNVQAEDEIGPERKELSLALDDKELIHLKQSWEKDWNGSDAQKQITNKGDENTNYWKGVQFDSALYSDNKRPLQDNAIFEAIETFLPQATAKNPEPTVRHVGSGVVEDPLSQGVKDVLAYFADTGSLKLKIKDGTRNWILRYVGIWKIGFNTETRQLETYVVDPKKLVLDPEGKIVNGQYEGECIGERKKDTASFLTGLFPKHKEYFKKVVDGKMGTKVDYIEWWTDEYVFWTHKDKVLDKARNFYFNYSQEEKYIDELGNERTKKLSPINHFKSPKKPYAFLVVHSTGAMPCDDTNEMDQALTLQDATNKRIRQIDKNADNANAGAIVSGDNFTKEQAAEVGEALRKGNTVWVPNGDVNTAYRRDVGRDLPAYVYNSLVDYRNRLADIFGIRGSTAGNLQGENTVRGKILAKQSDSSRMGSGVTEYIEQSADFIYNYWTQMMFVFFTDQDFIDILGQERGMSVYQELFTNRQSVLVSVKEGSLIPQDELTQRNEAVDLFNAGALDPLTLFERLRFPNPEESARKLMEFKNPGAVMPQEQAVAPEAPQLPLIN